MPENQKQIRLAKAAREFNLGVSSVVEFLKKKGQNVESSPNTKLSFDQYNLLLKEFKSEKEEKAEISRKGLDIKTKDSVSIKISKKEQNKAIEADISDNVEVTTDMKEKFAAEAKEKIAQKEAKKQEAAKKQETAKKQEAPKKQEVKKTVTPVKEVKDEPKKEDSKPIVKVETTIKVVAKDDEKKTEQPTPKKEKIQEPKKEEVNKSTDPIIVRKIDLSTLEKKKPNHTQKNKDHAHFPPKKGNPNQHNKPVIEKKHHESHVINKPHKATGKPNISNPKPAPKKAATVKVEPTHIDTLRPVLKGVTVTRSIELPKEIDKKKAAEKREAQKKENAAKRKRKRIKRNDGTKPGAKPNPNANNNNIHRKPRPNVVPSSPNNRKRPVKKATKGIAKPIITEEEVQRKLKQTLAKLSGHGKSKGSKLRRQKRDNISRKEEEKARRNEADKTTIKVTEFVTANELASMMDIPVTNIIATCMSIGVVVSINQRLNAETINLVASEFGFEVEFVGVEVQESIGEDAIVENNVTPRSPIITVMGHVDHGKTSLLDYIRHSNVIGGEAGGITQHIGAYEVELKNGRKITFLDTPGHEAFTAMRARGAQMTDVAIIVVAADDQVMPQTKEAINHAQAAGVPIVFAINKIDKAGANPDNIKTQLSAMNLLVEDWGGKIQSHDISAKTGIGVEELLEKVLLEADLLELKCDMERPAIGTVLESSLDKGRGYVTKVLVQNGVLNLHNVILAGYHYGKIKAMFNERNLPVKEAGPSAPVLLIGLNGAPQAGDSFNVMKDEKETKHIASKRQQLQREQGLRTQKHITLDEIGRRIAIGEFKELNLIIKGDMDGSVEALSDSMLKLSNKEVQVNIIHKSVGQVSESDVLLASASDAIIVCFQVRPSLEARKTAEKEQIDIRTYSVIYTAIAEIKDAIAGMLSPEIQEKITCNIEVREIFKITKIGTIAGCMVLDGRITRNTNIRVIRDGIVVYTGKLGSLKRHKDDVKEVNSGYECGLNIDNYNDIKAGDIIEGYEQIEVERKL